MSGKVSSKIVTDGLVLNLDGANPKSYVSGSTIWTDLTYYRNNGTLINGPTYNSNNNGSIVFDGTNDYVNTDFIPTIGIGDITYDVWFKTSIAQTGAIINVRSASATQFVLALCGDSGVYGSNLFLYSYNNVFDRGVVTTETWIDNTWHHVVAVHTSTSDTLYVDGNLRGSVTTSSLIINNSTKLKIGALGDGINTYPNWYFNGSISNVKVYYKVLTDSEVLQNYNALKNRFI